MGRREVVKVDSDILFIYQAKMANPNGDPDEGNRPRMDKRTGRNLVSDVRLKRYLRDLIIADEGWEKVWVTKVEGEHVDATKRLSYITKSKDEKEIVRAVTSQCIDARLFGATIPIKGGGGAGQSVSVTGPVQFSWGFSLHRVDEMDNTITSTFKGRDVEAEAGTMGKDYRVYYSMIAFYGRVSSYRARDTGLTYEDLEKYVDKKLWESLRRMTDTRSKIGQSPLLYMRIEYKEPFSIGDLRSLIEVEELKESIRDMDDLKLSFDKLVKRLEEVKDKILTIVLKVSKDFEERFGIAKALRNSAVGDKVKEEIVV